MNPLSGAAVLWVALILLQPVWYLWLAPPSGGHPALALGLTLPPLLLPLFGLRTGLRRALLWVGILALFYFCHGLVAAWAVPSTRMPALLEAVLCTALIGLLGWDARMRRQTVRRP